MQRLNSFSNMTDNLYELNHLTNDSNGAFLQNSLTRPANSQNDLSPVLDIQHGGGSWDCNQLEKSASSLITETMDSHVVYPINIAVSSNSVSSSKFSAGDQQTLDSFSKVFPIKSTDIAYRVGDKSSEDMHGSQILLSPQSGAPSDVSDREPFSPVTMRCQSQQFHNPYMHHATDGQNMTHNLYQNHQQYQYPQTQPAYKVPFYKSQGQYLIQQQGLQIYQHQLTSYSLALQKQQSQVDVHEGQEAVGSPTYSYTEDYKAPVQASFQSAAKGLPLHSPHFQGPEQFCSLSHQHDPYQHQQLNEQSHSFPFKQEHMVSVDDVHDFSSPQEDVCVDLIFPNKRDDFFSSHYQNMDTGVNQPAQSTTLRGGVLHLNAYRPQWTQMCSSGVQDNQTLPYFRNEAVRSQGSKTKLKCILCQREFKSLPALNGHMRSHGGIRTHPSTFKDIEGQIQLSREVTQTDQVVFPVSVPVKEYQIPPKLTNSIHGHKKQNDFADFTESCPQLPFSLQKVISSRAKKPAGVTESEAKQDKKRYRHCLVPLVISPYNASLEARGPVLFQSQLRSPSSCGDGAPYTPPPMLSPVRPGSGLFSSINAGQLCEPVPQVRLCKENEGEVTSAPEDKSTCMKPRINIGTNYQAFIPDIQSRCKMAKDIDKSDLLWTPCHLDTPEKLQRVDNLLKMACSSALPGGGTNIEFTLHCLFACRGDVMRTLEKLLSLEPPNIVNNTDYHYAGSDKWTLQEKRQLNKALLLHAKDFHHVQKMVKTKSVAQCVEYYYTWKERLRLGRRFGTGPVTSGIQETENKAGTRQPMRGTYSKNKRGDPKYSDNLSAVSVCEVSGSGSMFNGDEWNHANMGILSNSPLEHNRSRSAQHISAGSVKSSPSNSTTSGDTESNFIFPCTECGKVFLKVKSRNAHMKTHRHQDDSQFWQLHSLTEQETQPVTPASPSVIPPIIHHTLPCNSGEDVQPLPINNT